MQRAWRQKPFTLKNNIPLSTLLRISKPFADSQRAAEQMTQFSFTTKVLIVKDLTWLTSLNMHILLHMSAKKDKGHFWHPEIQRCWWEGQDQTHEVNVAKELVQQRALQAEELHSSEEPRPEAEPESDQSLLVLGCLYWLPFGLGLIILGSIWIRSDCA